MQILENPRVGIPPVLGPPMSPDISFDRDYAQNNIKKELGRPLKQPRIDNTPILEPPLPPDLIFDRYFAHINDEMKVIIQSKQTAVEDLCVTSGDIPPHLSPPLIHPDSAADKNGGGGIRNIKKENYHNVAQRNGD